VIATACTACGRPIAPRLPTLDEQVLELLDAGGPASASAIARELHRRKATMLAAVQRLEAQGLCVRSGHGPNAVWQPASTNAGEPIRNRVGSSEAAWTVDSLAEALIVVLAAAGHAASPRAKRAFLLAAGLLLAGASEAFEPQRSALGESEALT